MASKLSTIKMEYEMDSIASGAFWLSSFEADSFNTFVTGSEGTKIPHTIPQRGIILITIDWRSFLGYDDAINTAEQRRKVASQLLETLEGSEKHDNGEKPKQIKPELRVLISNEPSFILIQLWKQKNKKDQQSNRAGISFL